VSPNLTLNLGLRYDVFTAPVEAHGNNANVNLETGALIVGGSAGVNTDYHNVAPRVGFAYSASNKTVVHGGFGLTFFPTDIQNAIVLINPPYSYAQGITLGLSLSAGIPTPVPSSTTALTGALTGKDFNFHTGYLEQYNLFVERQVGSYVASIGYVGNLGRHLLQNIPNLNIPMPGGTKLPYADVLPKVNTINYYHSGGASSYDAFQASVQRKYSSGISFNANYTYAHSLDDIFDTAYGTSEAYGLIPTAIPTYDYGNGDLDIRHRLGITAAWDLPFGSGTTGIRHGLTAGWQVNSLAFWQTGLPFTVVNNNPTIGLPTVTTDRPNVIGNTHGSGSVSEFFNIHAFQPQAPGTAGDERRNQLFGPHARRVDLSLFKTVGLTERLKLQLRAECFNISNTPNFAQPNNTISATDPKNNNLPTNAGGFGTITTVNPGVLARQFQFAAKILF
jgi:hypothetical protein